MGYQGTYALISMTNKDVYYISQKVAHELMDLLEKGEAPAFYMVVDSKSGNEISIATANISSVVVKGGQNG